MKVPIDWLKEFVPMQWTPKELAHRLTMAGFEVEGMEGGILDVNVTPNRGDCLSILGLAREVSVLQSRSLQFKPTPAPQGKASIKEVIRVEVSDKKGCPRYMARAILGVTIASSPPWLQKKLEQVGIRPVNNVVDCTNTVMWELGHPLHAFDYRFLRDHKIVVQRSQSRQNFTALDGTTRICEPSDLLIGDGQGPIALAGIMGGADSEVKENTKDVVIEAAFFDPKTIHATAHRLNLLSESSCRFERWVDPNGVANALHRVVQLIVETAGGVPTVDWIDLYPKKFLPTWLTLKLSEVERYLGIKIAEAKLALILKSLHFKVTKRGAAFQVEIPTFRNDIAHPIDLIEEIARLYGYDRIPETRPQIRSNFQAQSQAAMAMKRTQQFLLGLGYTEACHLNFVSSQEAQVFAPDPLKVVSLSNPLSQDQSLLRSSLAPGLLRGAAFNATRQGKNLKLFEMGKVFEWADGKVQEARHLGLVVYGEEFPLQWQLPKKEVDFFTLKGALSSLAKLWGVDDFLFSEETVPPFLVPGQSAVIRWRDEKIGWLGMIQPKFSANYEIKVPIYACELTIEKIINICGDLNRRFKSIPKFPFVERDLALVVSQEVAAGKIKRTIEEAKISLLQSVRFFDLFKGGELSPDQKSIALHICYASSERTLTNEEVNVAHQSLRDHLEKTLPAKLR